MINTMERFSPHTFAVYRHVWNLSEGERDRLDRCFMLRCSGAVFTQSIARQHEYKDTIKQNKVTYEVCYIDCGYEVLRSRLANVSILLSFRFQTANKLAFCLVKQPYRNADLSNIQEL